MSKNKSNRRDFLKVAAGSAMASSLILQNVHAAENDFIKVGVIGCGGRGTGAADNVLNAAPNVKVVALADAFEDRLNKSLSRLQNLSRAKTVQKLGNMVDVPKERQFVGLDAYKRLLATDVNYVILATPPGFRPMHIEAAVAADKNIFTEKPVAVDPVGIRKVLAAYEAAKKKKNPIGIGVGTQRRHQRNYVETMKRLHDGAIGKIVGARCYWNQGGLWSNARKNEWSDLEWHIRNWLYFTWISGDHIVEQHVHNIDVVNWGLQAHPLKAVALGGRQQRTAEQYGHIFDHFAVDFEYPEGVHVLSMCRQIPGTAPNVSEGFVGTKGNALTWNRKPCKINGENVIERGSDNLPYVQEHTDLIESIRKGDPYNELQQVAHSTLSAIMGRMAAYTGKEVTWDFALNTSKLDLMPKGLTWDSKLEVPAPAIPGQTKLV